MIHVNSEDPVYDRAVEMVKEGGCYSVQFYYNFIKEWECVCEQLKSLKKRVRK